MRRTARTAADGVGARGWLEMGGEKKPLVMSDLGCTDGCGRQMGAENCVDGCGRRGCNGVLGNGWGEEVAGDEATLAARTAADGKWVRRTARTAADGVGATEWLEMGGEKKPLVMSDLSCADGCGRQMGAENCVDGCGELRGWLRTAWVQRSGWKRVGRRERKGKDRKGKDRKGKEGTGRERKGKDWKGRKREEAAGDERPWLRGRLRTANGSGELRGRLRTAWVQGGGWKWVERRSRW